MMGHIVNIEGNSGLGYSLRMSISAGDTYWVPEIHSTLEMVGRGGATACSLKSLSSEDGLFK